MTQYIQIPCNFSLISTQIIFSLMITVLHVLRIYQNKADLEREDTEKLDTGT